MHEIANHKSQIANSAVEHLRVFCDFDGTISTVDVTDYILQNLADPSWLEIEARWERGEIGSRECMALQIALIKGGWTSIRELLHEVKLDPTFKPFVAWCAEKKIPLVVVSEGMDRVIHYLLRRDGIKPDAIWANRLCEDAHGKLVLEFPWQSLDERICNAGLCKCRVLERTHEQSFNVVIGDGNSDRCWAKHATFVAAKSKLLLHCRKNNIPCHPFEDFNMVRESLKQLLHRRAAKNT